MMQLPRWKVIAVLLVTVLAILFAVPNVLPKSFRDSLPGWVPAKTLNLGLDLQGGSYLLLEVKTDALKRDKLVKMAEEIRSALRSDEVPFSGPAQIGDAVRVTINDPAQIDKAYKTIAGLVAPQAGAGAEFDVRRGEAQTITATIIPAGLRAAESRAVTQSIEIVRRRIDSTGAKEVNVVPQGTNRIAVSAPGESDPEALKNLIGKTARLTFQMVDYSVPVAEAAASAPPPGSELLPYDDDPAGILVYKRPVITGEMLTKANAAFDDKNQPIVHINFNRLGGSRFGRATAENVGKQFAIVLDGRVISAPTIQEAIPGGSGQITMRGALSEANTLAVQLSAGALPAELATIEQRTIGAELGADAVQAGKISTLIGFLAIVVFMLLAYGFLFGGISVVGLVLNLTMLVAVMSAFGATLTLPGIAGLILTLAVAVDANVLIYERIRDEERGGARPVVAIETGFKRASVSIYDANVTTLISALIMFMFGSGPVKGFALNLGIGVACSLFTAMIMSQVVIALWFRAARPKTLPI